MAQHNELGFWGEDQAADYLRKKGYFVFENDWKSGHRDIDIIAKDGDTIVFVEVKTRRNRVFTEPTAAVDYRKLQNLKRAINHYVKFHRIDNDIRLDIITVVGTPESGTPEIEHIIDVPII